MALGPNFLKARSTAKCRPTTGGAVSTRLEIWTATDGEEKRGIERSVPKVNLKLDDPRPKTVTLLTGRLSNARL